MTRYNSTAFYRYKHGDCDGNDEVSIGEVQKAINMFLGSLAPACGADGNGDGTVSVGEVQKVINAFLGLGAIGLSVSPPWVALAPGGSQQFAASVTGTDNTAVTWSVLEGAPGGTVSQAGLYTAPQGPACALGNPLPGRCWIAVTNYETGTPITYTVRAAVTGAKR